MVYKFALFVICIFKTNIELQMVEAAKEPDTFKLSDTESALVLQHLGDDFLVDPQYKATCELTEAESQKRAQLVEDVEYSFQLALKKGDYYLGSAFINFYLADGELKDGELFLNFNGLAIADLNINDEEVKDKDVFKGQRIQLSSSTVSPGWNTLRVKYINAYGKSSVGLYTATDAKDDNQYLTS